jgi:ferredoxin
MKVETILQPCKLMLVSLMLVFASSFNTKLVRSRYYRPLNSVEEWLLDAENPSEVPPRRIITVRFVNNLTGKDITIETEEGKNLLAVGDKAGVKLPRACRTGLCGSCTCEVEDPKAIATSTNPRNGFATIRACSYNCYVKPGMTEMVVDVHRMKTRAAASASPSKGESSSFATSQYVRYLFHPFFFL